MDSRGHGRSSFDDRPISYDLMASDVLRLMDHLGIENADIVGWSDGGIIGLHLAIHHPERLNKVVAYGANFDPTGVRIDLPDNAYFNAFKARNADEYRRLSPHPERWDQVFAIILDMWAAEPSYTEDQIRWIKTPMLILDGAKEEAIDLNADQAHGAPCPWRQARDHAGHRPLRPDRAAKGIHQDRGGPSRVIGWWGDGVIGRTRRRDGKTVRRQDGQS
jgi:pimeloyl-ACP methyl ester carboxylesterase